MAILKNDGLHKISCWTRRLDGFLWIRFGLHLQLVMQFVVVTSHVVQCFEEHLLQWHALQIYPWENSSLPHVKDFQYTEVSPGRLSADAKKLTLHFIQAKRIYKFKRQQELACFQISLRNLWQLQTSNGTKMDATVVSIGWISGYPWMPISFTTPWAFMAKKIPGRVLYVFWRCMLDELWLYCAPVNGKAEAKGCATPSKKDDDAMEGSWVECCMYWSLQDNLE